MFSKTNMILVLMVVIAVLVADWFAKPIIGPMISKSA
jgi:hypothetical protein